MSKRVSTTPENTSSASDSVSGGEKYEVFLSFRGPDTRKAFTDFLFTLLVENNIRTFRDNEELSVGEEIRPELLKAIEESEICIPIFSQDYASSKSCLLELAHMVGCHKIGGKKIIPVFYDVEPSDVEHQRGSYEEGFRQHEKTRDQKTIQHWKDALKVVAQLKGLSKKDTDGYEGALTKRIVEEVLEELKKNYMHVPELVGMDHHVYKMEKLLNVESSGVRIVGIHGMGGIGKSTIAKFFYNQLYEAQSFKCCCFLEDIRETSQQKGVVYLQSQLLSRILKDKGRVIDNVDNGITKIRAAVKGKKVLIVLDDVDEKSQFNNFADDCDFGSGSRIIVTTRNKEVLNGLKVICKEIGQLEVYQPDLMNPDDSLRLFSKHAFESLSPPKYYYTLSKEVVSYAAGLPLVRVVTGSLLRGEKNKTIWEKTSKKLKNIPADQVQKKLRISFDALDIEQKQIFLDIACLSVGEDKTNLIYMWDACGFFPQTGINDLVCRSFIKVGDDNTIWMHDQVRDLGRRIVDEENFTHKGARSRLWRPDEALSILESHTGTNKVVALCVDKPERPCLDGKYFKKLGNLRYLRLGYADFGGDFKHRFFNLRWLQWECPGELTLTNLGLKNLVVLKLSSSGITDEWEGWSEIKMATKLKVLEIRHCQALRSVHCSTFSTLESLDLHYCGRVRSLDGLEQLKSLTQMDISDCTHLQRLRDLSNLKKLKKLKISRCPELIKIQGLDRLESLQLLDMYFCESIERLPDLSNLRMLKELKISECLKLLKVMGLAGLESLEWLCMSGCRSLGLPDPKDPKLTFGGGLDGLEEVKLLEWLDISGCGSIVKLPDLSSLKNLKQLKAIGCTKLTEIGGLGESLELLDLDNHAFFLGCDSFEKLPDLSSLKNLKWLNVHTVKLTEIRGLGELRSLELLNLVGCESIEKLPDLSSLKNLREINVSNCVKLTEIGGFGELKSLELLKFGGCESIEKLPDLSSVKNLREINVFGCVKLTEIGGLGELKSLELLNLGGCESIEKLPDLSSLKNLREINVSNCVKLTEIGRFGELKSLELLKLGGCESIEKLPDLSSLKNLREINVSNCVKLTEIGGFGELKSLELLKLGGCESIEKLPDLSSLKNLREINVSNCVKLTEIGGFEKLKSLELLKLDGCESIEKLPDLSSLKNLREIDVFGCVKLTEIGGLEELKSLEYLDIRASKLLGNLPSLPNTLIETHWHVNWL